MTVVDGFFAEARVHVQEKEACYDPAFYYPNGFDY